jgi:hypothetical protein
MQLYLLLKNTVNRLTYRRLFFDLVPRVSLSEIEGRQLPSELACLE